MDDAQFGRFVDLIQTRFQEIDARFDQMDARFDQIDARFDRLEGRVERIENQMTLMRSEMIERFLSVSDRLGAVERRVSHLDVAIRSEMDSLHSVAAGLRGDIDTLKQLTHSMDNGVHELTVRINDLGDDMRQRFRIVTERLVAVEGRMAA